MTQRICALIACIVLPFVLYGCGGGGAPACDATDTGGSCKLFKCGASRGDTDCVDGHCVCQEGLCAVDGACSAPGGDDDDSGDEDGGDGKDDGGDGKDDGGDGDGDMKMVEIVSKTSPVLAATVGFVFGAVVVGIAAHIQRRSVVLNNEPLIA